MRKEEGKLMAEAKEPTNAELLMEYAEAVREQERLWKAREAAMKAYEAAEQDRQALWRRLSARRAGGTLKPGIYRVGLGPHDEGIHVTSHGDYPELLRMFDANRT